MFGIVKEASEMCFSYLLKSTFFSSIFVKFSQTLFFCSKCQNSKNWTVLLFGEKICSFGALFTDSHSLWPAAYRRYTILGLALWLHKRVSEQSVSHNQNILFSRWLFWGSIAFHKGFSSHLVVNLENFTWIEKLYTKM